MPGIVQYSQSSQPSKQIITLPKTQSSTSSISTNSPQIIVLKNQASSNSIISSNTTNTATTTATSNVINNFQVKQVQTSSANQHPNPTILKLVSTKINKMPQILNISSQTFNNNLLKTNMRPVSNSINSSTNLGSNPLIIKSNVPQTIINNNNTKPNQIVHLSKINTSNFLFKLFKINNNTTKANNFLFTKSNNKIIKVNEIMNKNSVKLKNEVTTAGSHLLTTPMNTSKPINLGSQSKSIADLLNTAKNQTNKITTTVLQLTNADSTTPSNPTVETSIFTLKQLDGFDDSQTPLVLTAVDLNTDSSFSMWYDIILTPNLSHTVTEYSLNPLQQQTTSELFKKQLEPGTSYKFRVAGVNSCGRGAWSEVSAFSTCMPGYPGAPSSIKITKSSNNSTHISWEPPQVSCGVIKEYSVYLSVKVERTGLIEQQQQQRQQLSFVQIYCGTESSCLIDAENLSKANIDYSSKPAVLFRIAAKNEKGYGPATQVRWLQGKL